MTNKKPIYFTGIFLIFCFSFWMSYSGVDYGNQWDMTIIKGLVNKYIRTQNWLPGWYAYPPVSSYISMIATLPYRLPFIKEYGFADMVWPYREYMLGTVLNQKSALGIYPFHLNLRRVFVLFTMLSVLWTGFAAAQKNKVAGLVSAAVLGLSWEVSYHARLVSPDGVTMQAVALALLFVLVGFYRKKHFNKWFVFAAMAVALATATKYTAGIALFSILSIALAKWKLERTKASHTILWGVMLIIIFSITFVALVPGVLLETDIFLHHLESERIHYATGHGRQTVNAGLEHFYRIGSYLLLGAFSRFQLLALLLFLISIVGAHSLISRNNLNMSEMKKTERLLSSPTPGLFIGLFIVPLIYVIYLSSQRVMFVRNLLVIFPHLAILAGFGFSWVLEQLSGKKLARRSFVAGVLSIFIINSLWIMYSVWTIEKREIKNDQLVSQTYVNQATYAISFYKNDVIYIAPAASEILIQQGRVDIESLDNVTHEYSSDVDWVLFAYHGDATDSREGWWLVNWSNASPIIFGPQEINMDWYAHWPGDERLVLAKTPVAFEADIHTQP